MTRAHLNYFRREVLNAHEILLVVAALNGYGFLPFLHFLLKHLHNIIHENLTEKNVKNRKFLLHSHFLTQL